MVLISSKVLGDDVSADNASFQDAGEFVVAWETVAVGLIERAARAWVTWSSEDMGARVEDRLRRYGCARGRRFDSARGRDSAGRTLSADISLCGLTSTLPLPTTRSRHLALQYVTMRNGLTDVVVVTDS